MRHRPPKCGSDAQFSPKCCGSSLSSLHAFSDSERFPRSPFVSPPYVLPRAAKPYHLGENCTKTEQESLLGVMCQAGEPARMLRVKRPVCLVGAFGRRRCFGRPPPHASRVPLTAYAPCARAPRTQFP